ncbi:efflux RND transporter periplasmic adaptor subunit [Fusibacter paucivorans]|uniref:Efflux RND transporter periplasmic adaptor subunit n=1 Tax=Fusibacter paucivorans TaxID=76009 RepID=A0ABS5PT31_9FIRM|nr:efflux RND transporter periplasmic adaptor subunit [Fusibacter paucivorans]MBS7528329.1 efflux RND transporter periplasmic adaptor subunit [Fusibacter paucivorans]
MKKRHTAFRLVGILVGVLVAFSGCSNSYSTETATITETKSVKSEVISQSAYTESLSYLGYVAPRESIVLNFESSGKVEKLYVEEGAIVTKGEPIAAIELVNLQRALDNEQANVSLVQDSLSQYKLTLSEMALQLDSMQTTYENTKQLYEIGSVSTDAFNQVKMNYDIMKMEYQNTEVQMTSTETKLSQAMIGLSRAQEAVDKATIYAPMDGIVADLPLTVGETISAGMMAATVDSMDSSVFISVPVDDYNQISETQSVTLSGNGETAKGIVSSIARTPDNATRTYQVEIEIPKNDFLTGTLLNVDIPLAVKQGYLIPLSAIVNMDDIDYIYTLRADETAGEGLFRVNQVEVNVVGIFDNRVLVDNLTSDVQIVSEGLKGIKSADLVTVVE